MDLEDYERRIYHSLAYAARYGSQNAGWSAGQSPRALRKLNEALHEIVKAENTPRER